MRQTFTLCAVLLLPFTSATHAAPVSSGTVTIISTGDRLTPGYRVTVAPNGALASTLVPAGQKTPIRRTDEMVAVNRRRFFADLAAAEPLNTLPTGARSAPASAQRQRGRRSRQTPSAGGATPYPQVYVRYQGRQSPNLRAAGSSPGRALYQDVKQILQVLRLPIPNQP